MNNAQFVEKLIEASDRSTLRLVPEKYELSFSDYGVGCEELGFMRFLKSSLKRDAINWMEAEDIRYERFVRRHKRIKVSVANGYAYVKDR